MVFKLIPSQLYGWISEKFLRKSLLQTLIHWLKRCSSKWPAVSTYVQNSFWVLKLPLATLGCYDTDARLFTYLNNKPFFLHEFKTLSYDGLSENKKILDENQRFDWMKSIPGYPLVNISWLADINLFNSMIWLS